MKKNKLKISLILLFLICIGAVFVKRGDQIYEYTLSLRKDFARQREYKRMHNEDIDISSLKPLVDEKDAWYTKYHYICHGGGGIDGKSYSNSLEGMELAYSKGNRVYDSDMTFTKDGVLILRHSWSDNLEQTDIPMEKSYSFVDQNGHTQHLLKEKVVMSYKDFMSNKIYKEFTPMDCKAAINFLKTHKDAYIAPDMKDDPVLSYTYLVEEAKRQNAIETLDRIIVNIYEYALYDKILKIYPFKNVTIRQHYVHPNNYNELITFCIKNNIHVVNVSSKYAYDEGIKRIQSKGIRVFIAVADYISDMKEYKKLGFSGAVTNWLTEDKWNLIEK